MKITFVTFLSYLGKQTEFFYKNETPEQMHSFLIVKYTSYKLLSIIEANDAEFLSLNTLERLKDVNPKHN